jgi:hypothetical protein
MHDRTPTQHVDKHIKINTVHRTTILMNEVTHTHKFASTIARIAM